MRQKQSVSSSEWKTSSSPLKYLNSVKACEKEPQEHYKRKVVSEENASRKHQDKSRKVNPTKDDTPRTRGVPAQTPVGFVEEQALGSQKDASSWHPCRGPSC